MARILWRRLGLDVYLLLSSPRAWLPPPSQPGAQSREQWGQMLLEAAPPAPISVLCLISCSGARQDKRQDFQEHKGF